jgi:hypothetical protein
MYRSLSPASDIDEAVEILCSTFAVVFVGNCVVSMLEVAAEATLVDVDVDEDIDVNLVATAVV